MSYSAYDPYYSGTRSRRPSLSYTSTPASFHSHGVPLSSSYHEPAMQQGYSQPSYSMYASTAGNLSAHHLPATSYDDIGVHDPYYRGERRGSFGGSVGAYPPLVQPMAAPRRRRSSSVSYSSAPGFVDSFRRGSAPIVKFKRKGAFRSGITLGEAQANVRLSGWDSYSFRDLNVDGRGKIYVNIRWPGYSPLNYEIPVDGYNSYVDLQSLARRVGRAVAHYLQANVIPIPWDRIELQYMEEMAMGTWHLKMSTQ
ncbi:hypothetical protein HYDPIDRAFT_105142 [Hydnomerulius pinastri MD-312]|nr:hypothetical protein HYDPIDRAFT_105142 [Hydnomerulius pinastri MD-312]